MYWKHFAGKQGAFFMLISIIWTLCGCTIDFIICGKSSNFVLAMMNELFRKIVVSLGAYLIVSSAKSQDALRQQIDDLKQRQEENESELQDTKTYVSGDSITKDLHYSYQLELGSIADTLWNGRFTWTIENKNASLGYYIQDLRSSITIDSCPVDLFVPGNRQRVYIGPGKTVKINSTWQDKKWISSSAARTTIREAVKRICGKKSIVSCPANTQLPGLLIVNGTTYETTSQYAAAKMDHSITANQPGTMVYMGNIFAPKNSGTNYLDWK